MCYIVVMPAYNESEYISRTLDSLCQQNLSPLRLIVVDDGSSDDTPEIVRQYAAENPSIHLVQKGASDRAVGSKVVHAFNAGYATIPDELDYEFIVKLDADLELPSDYFMRVAEMFEKYGDCGLCGGYCIIPEEGSWVREKTAPMHIRGAFKAIRRNVFEEIGGFMPVMGWDGIDQIKLLSKGWKIAVLDVPVKHFRPTGQASVSAPLYRRMGQASYRRGYDLFLAGLAAFKLAVRRKKLLCLVWYVQGFIKAWIKKETRYLNESEIRFLRQLQYQRLISEQKVLDKYAYIEKYL